MVDSRATDALLSELGVRIMAVFPVSESQLKPYVKVSWLHDFNIGDRAITAAFAGAPDAPFTVDGPEADSDGALLGAGLYYLGSGGFSAGLGFDAELRDTYNAQNIWGELRYSF